jgi:FHA domain
MSFRWFIYYCAVCGGCAALVGWTLGIFPSRSPSVLSDALKALCVGLMLGVVLALIDSLVNFSWGQFFLIAARVLTAGVAGGVAGLIGGSITGGVTRNLNALPLQIAGQILGWTCTGLLIGASVGVFDLLLAVLRKHDVRGSLRKVVHGLSGGAVGGLLGSLLYLLLYGALGSLFGDKVDLDKMWTPGAAGFVALGLCIGLLIGAAQVILKEAWVKVEAGSRPGRELIVSKGEIVIGRAESCDVGLFGDNTVERTHARILRRGDRYLLVDADTLGGTFLNGLRITEPTPLRSGDEIRVGKNRLRFGERRKRPL